MKISDLEIPTPSLTSVTRRLIFNELLKNKDNPPETEITDDIALIVLVCDLLVGLNIIGNSVALPYIASELHANKLESSVAILTICERRFITFFGFNKFIDIQECKIVDKLEKTPFEIWTYNIALLFNRSKEYATTHNIKR